jgi:hypothetical protein
MYYANNFFKLSTPLDLLKFSPLPFFDRIRLGLLALRARRVKDWRALEDRTAATARVGKSNLPIIEVDLRLWPTHWPKPSMLRVERSEPTRQSVSCRLILGALPELLLLARRFQLMP